MKRKILFMTTCSLLMIMMFCSINVIALKNKTIITKTKVINQEENIVLLGDSIFDWYPTDKIFDDLPIVNSGVAGNKTEDILDDMQRRVYQYNPTKVFILIGTNDIEFEDSEKLNNRVANKIIKISDKIRNKRKNCEIYIMSILPVNNDMGGAKERHISEIKTINSKVREHCNQIDNVTYIDAFSNMINDNEMFLEDYTKDGLHPNDLGYAKITEILMKYIYN